MSFYENAIRDPRVREYLPVRSVVLQEKVTGAELLPENSLIQPLLEDDFGSFVRIEKGGFIVLDFGREIYGGVRLINSSESGKIRLRFGESVAEVMGDPDQDHAIHDEILSLPRMGFLEYGSTGFRFVRIDGLTDTGVRLRNVPAVVMIRDIPRRGTFRCSDPELNAIWETAVYTLQLNMQEYLFDGVKRDKLVWTGDLYVEICAALAAFGDLPILRESLDFSVRHTPALDRLGGISSFSCWWIIALEHYVQATGNAEFLRQERDVIEQMIPLILKQIRPDGCEQFTEMRFLDWFSHRDEKAKHAGLQGILAWTLKALRDLAGRLDLPCGTLEAALEKVKRFPLPPCGGNPGAAALQYLSGLTTAIPERLPEAVDMFSSFFVLKAIAVPDMLALLKRQWGGMLARGATAFWEEYDPAVSRIDTFTPSAGSASGDHCYAGTRRSLCHGWGSGPAAVLPEKIFGLRFLTPARIRVSPAPGDLQWAEATIPLMQGDLFLSFDGKQLKMRLPEGVTAENGTTES